MVKVDKKINVVIKFNDKDGLVNISRNGKIIGHIEFIVQRSQIMVTDVTVSEKYQRKGYGKLLMTTLQRYAQEKMLPIYLFSIESAIKFYKSCDFFQIRKYKGDCKLHLKNVVNYDEQVSDTDMMWIPKGKKSATVYL